MDKYKRYFKSILVLYLLVAIVACSDDDDEPVDPEGSGATYSVDRCNVLAVTTEAGNEDSAYEWAVTQSASDRFSLTNSGSQKVLFAAVDPGEYELTVTIDGSETETHHVTVNEESDSYKTYIDEVYDFCPAPGQFINDLPPAVEGDSYETVLRRANSYLAKEEGILVSLGGFGGYVVFGFDHTIVNVEGKRDFRVIGNAFWADANPNADASSRGGSCEPGVIMVAYDQNGNGEPDDDEWYEIKGSAYDMEGTVHNYEITYYRPDPDKEPVSGGGTGTVSFTDVEYIKWTDNQDNTDYLWQNNATNHSLDYWPLWQEDQENLTFRGTLLPDNAVDESGSGTYYVLYSYEYGYADNAPNTDDESAIDIDWAIDEQGNFVHLPGIDFVKVYNGLNQQAGWLGETSTEIAGATDLHLKDEDIATRSIE